MSKVRIALIGCGKWGLNFARVISRNDRCEFVLACDILSDMEHQVKRFCPAVQFTTDLDEVCKQPGIDAVVVATPVSSHFIIVSKLLGSGKHVLCEKPLCMTGRECDDLLQMAGEKKKTLMTGHVFLHHDGIGFIRQVLEKQELGELKYMTFRRTGLGPIRNDVDVIGDLATHDLSIIKYLIPAPVTHITAYAHSFLQTGINDVAFLNLEWGREMMANIHVSWIEPVKTREIIFVGTKKMLVFNDVVNDGKISIYNKGVSYQSDSGDYGAFQLAIRDGEVVLPNIRIREPLAVEFDRFLDMLNNPVLQRAEALMTKEVIRLIEASGVSAEEGNRKVAI